jgi:predicted alpha/beta-hydrolase family hydrolase
MSGESFSIQIQDGVEVTAIREMPDGGIPKGLLVYAPGAGSNINDPFGAYLSRRLVDSSYCSVRFQFPYMEAGKRRPDSLRVLGEVWRKVIAAATVEGVPLFVGGRSMGGRIASLVVAQGAVVDGLVLFAYPLHPPGRSSTPSAAGRVEHLSSIVVPTLFCSGTRDTFATREELIEAASMVPDSEVHILDGADHGFAVLKSSGRDREDVWTEATDSLLDWLAGLT